MSGSLNNNVSQLSNEAVKSLLDAIQKIKQIFNNNDCFCISYFEKSAAKAFGISSKKIHTGRSADAIACKAIVIYFVRNNSQVKSSDLSRHFKISRRQVERLYKSVQNMLSHPNGNKKLYEKFQYVNNQYLSDFNK